LAKKLQIRYLLVIRSCKYKEVLNYYWHVGTVENHENTETVIFVKGRDFARMPCFAMFFAELPWFYVFLQEYVVFNQHKLKFIV